MLSQSKERKTNKTAEDDDDVVFGWESSKDYLFLSTEAGDASADRVNMETPVSLSIGGSIFFYFIQFS